MQTHSVENRFIIIVFVALLIFVAPLFALFYFMTAERAFNERISRAEATMVANAQALGKPLWDFDVESVRKIAASAASDSNILAVRVEDTSGEIAIQLPENLDLPKTEIKELKTGIQYVSIDGAKEIGSLMLYVEGGGFLSTIDFRELSFLGIFIFAVFIVFAAAIVANRITIIRPLLRLTDAITATRHLGSRHRVDWNSTDEMGILARNFNEMQIVLEREEQELRSAHALVQSVYNQTPTMLYSLNPDGEITTVSDYWLLATGYKRADVLGKSFEYFVEETSLETYDERPRPELGGASTPGVTVGFVCAKGAIINVLIRETIASSETGQPQTLAVMTDVTELKEAEHRNHHQAITDHLTGLLNRQGFEHILDEKIAEANKAQEELACLFVDLDRFKWVNDNLGHAAGDMVLCEVVDRIQKQVRPSDAVARLGGDEFAILVPSRKAEDAAQNIAERIIEALETPFLVAQTKVSLSGSVGIALYPNHAKSASELLQKSDMAMYERKRNGKNGTQVFSDKLSDMTRVRASMERDISDALANDWFEPWIQPIINLENGGLVGVEALMRMRHPQRGILPPADIIVAAEENGTIEAIGGQMLEKSIQQLAHIQQLPGLKNARMGINISPVQINADLPGRISSLLLKNKVAPSAIVVEITEAVLMHDNPAIYDILLVLRNSGINLALDDFGTGYSSLSYLHRFPVNIVKIDMSFVRALTPESAQKQDKPYLLIKGITTIAHQMNCDVVAEGIENEEVALMLKELGVDYGQGYHFAKPMSIEAFENAYGGGIQRQIASS